MIVKKFYGRTVEEAIKNVKENLGEDASLLLVQKVKKKGLLGFFGATEIEVTAAKDISFEIQERVTTSYREDAGIDPPALSKIKRLLTEEEVDNDIISTIISSYIEATGGNQIKLKELDTSILTSIIKGLIKTERNQNYTGKTRAIFIGPPGVGKTTTILKLASYYSAEENKDVAIISTDIYRSGAIEQLKIYGKILNIPVETVFNVREFEKVIHKFRSMDIVFIDSAGRSKRNKEYVELLRKFIYTIPIQGLKIYLVISATDNFTYIKEIYDNYKILYPNSLIISKLDEAVTLGNLVNLPVYTNLPIGYVTDGQNIPGNIEIAKSEKLAELILKRNVISE
jgi:flagellar biosynthesis protein FlhF